MRDIALGLGLIAGGFAFFGFCVALAAAIAEKALRDGW